MPDYPGDSEGAEMNTVIHKFRLIGHDTQVELPESAVVRHVAEHRGDYCIWAQLDPTARHVLRRFCVYATGETMEENSKRKFVGTFLSHGGALVWHVFEEPLR